MLVTRAKSRRLSAIHAGYQDQVQVPLSHSCWLPGPGPGASEPLVYYDYNNVPPFLDKQLSPSTKSSSARPRAEMYTMPAITSLPRQTTRPPAEMYTMPTITSLPPSTNSSTLS